MRPSLYIHIPFCKRKCAYCDFYSAIYDEKLAAEYCRVLARELGALSIEPPTVYIGGGTPTALGEEPLRCLLAALEPVARKAAEVTVEANPESLTADKIRLLRDHGVNRLSVGVQSFRDAKLTALGRIHDAARAEEAVLAAASGGIANISVDLIFGVWDETPEAWREDLERAAALPVTHISAYGLTYEKGTPLRRTLTAGRITPLDDEVVAAMYEETIDRLAARGFAQ